MDVGEKSRVLFRLLGFVFTYRLKIKFKNCDGALRIDIPVQLSNVTGLHSNNAFGIYQVPVFVVALRCFVASLVTLLQVP
jgi:hypothetical protein